MTFLTPVMLLFALPCAALFLLWHLPGRTLPRLRVALLLLVLLALARPALRLPRRAGTLVVVADRSASVPSADRARQALLIERAGAQRTADGTLGVVSFATRAIVEHPPQTAPFRGFTAVHNEDASDLNAALHAAISAIPAGHPGRILVLSDGRFTGDDPRKAASRAVTAGIAIDYRLQARRSADDLAVVRVEAPMALRPNEALLATAWIDSPDEREVEYVLRRGPTELVRGHRRLPRGLSPLAFRDLARPTGVATYELALEAPASAPDPCPENNLARFLVQTTGGKPLLHFASAPGSRFPRLLGSGGVTVETLPPESFDGSLATLAGYSGVVLENVRADALGPANLANLAAWVEHAGAGLLMTGGRNSFGLGGYYKSAIEPVLPVTMELRREHRKFAMSIVVVMDRSGSMAAPVGGGRTKMDMANLGALEVLNLLSDQDEIAVIAVDSAPHVVVPRRSAANVRSDAARISGIESMGGGIFVYEGLKAGMRELAGATTGVRHVLLFADAADAEEPGDYKRLLANAAGAGITVSAIGLGTRADCDAALLEDIATRGGGTCSFSDSAQEIPRLFAQDTFAVARNTLVTNAVAPVFTQALPLLSDTLPPQAPHLGGYNLCYLHPGATAVAMSSDENAAPLVALRPVGSGRSLVFTGEADGALSGPFAQWAQAPEFHAALARYCAGPIEDDASGFLIRQRKVPGGVEIVAYADMTRPDVRAVDGLAVGVLRHRAGGAARPETRRLTWTTADTLAAVVPLSGGETLLATVALPGGRVQTLPPVCLPHSAEYAVGTEVDGAAVLAELAEATGGVQVAETGSVWERMPKERRIVEVAPWLFLVAALVFLVEVFERRTGWLWRRGRTPLRSAQVEEEAGEGNGTRGWRRRKHHAPSPTPSTAPAPIPPDEPPLPGPSPDPESSPFAAAKRRANRRM